MIFNIGYGPWQKVAWCHMILASGQKIAQTIQPNSRMVLRFWPRHLVENGAPFVMVANGMPWDSHVFHNEIYQMVIPDLDNIIYQLVTDLEERGMLDDTLVVAMGEFGRTPGINQALSLIHI